MPSKPQYIHALIVSVTLLQEQASNLRRDTDDLGTKHESVKETIAAIRTEVAVISRQLTEATSRIEKWEGRWWGLVVTVIVALLSLASGLVVALVRK